MARRHPAKERGEFFNSVVVNTVFAWLLDRVSQVQPLLEILRTAKCALTHMVSVYNLI